MAHGASSLSDRTAQPLLRILIASYFIAVGLGLIPGTDFTVLTALLLPAPFDGALAMATVFFLGYLVMTGHWLRGAALTLGLMTFWASYVTMLSLGVADELGGFWRDIALVAALMLTYGGPAETCPRCAAAPPPPKWRDRLPGLTRLPRRPTLRPAPAHDQRPRDQVSMEEMLSMFRADFERARPD